MERHSFATGSTCTAKALYRSYRDDIAFWCGVYKAHFQSSLSFRSICLAPSRSFTFLFKFPCPLHISFHPPNSQSESNLILSYKSFILIYTSIFKNSFSHRKIQSFVYVKKLKLILTLSQHLIQRLAYYRYLNTNKWMSHFTSKLTNLLERSMLLTHKGSFLSTPLALNPSCLSHPLAPKLKDSVLAAVPLSFTPGFQS